jgi:hypothetical protein
MKEILSAQRLTMTVEAYAVYRERLLTEPERFEDANTAARIASEVFRGLPKGRNSRSSSAR